MALAVPPALVNPRVISLAAVPPSTERPVVITLMAAPDVNVLPASVAPRIVTASARFTGLRFRRLFVPVTERNSKLSASAMLHANAASIVAAAPPVVVTAEVSVTPAAVIPVQVAEDVVAPSMI